MRTGISFISILLIVLTLSGCVTRLGDFTLISTKNVDLTRGASFKRAQSRVTGEDAVAMIIIIPTGVPNMKTAIDKAIESVPGAVALLDAVLSYKSFYLILFAQYGYIVEGTPLIDPTLISQSALPSNRIISKLDKNGNVIETKYVSKTEYDSFKKKAGL